MTFSGPLVSIGWSAIRTAPNPKWLAVQDLRLPKSTSEARRMEGIHAFARSRIRYQREDPGRDHWQQPAETLERGTGDCEDICIVERCLLLNAGFKDSDIEMMIVRDKLTREHHALLWVKEHYLDNRTHQVLHVSQFKDYEPISGHRAGDSYAYGEIAR